MTSQGNRPVPMEVPGVAAQSPSASTSSARLVRAGHSEQAFFRFDLRRSLQLHRRLVLTFAAVGLVLGLIYYLFKAPVYEAECVVYVQPATPSVIQQGFTSRWPYDSSTYDSYIQQQITNANREDVLTNALKKLGSAARKPNESDEDALNGLRRQLAIARVGQTYQFFIQARASSPELAAATANTVAAAYLESTVHDQRAGDQQRLTMLREERDRVQSALDADRAEQEELNKQLGVASVGGAPDHFDQDISEFRTELVKARAEHDSAEARFAAMGANHGDSSNAIDAAADASADLDAGLVSIKTALSARKAVLISKMANLTPVNPEYKQDAAELAQINGNLDQMTKDLRARAASHIQLQLRSDLERTAGVEAQLNSQLRQLVSKATNATSKLQRASDLAADITRLQSRYSSVDEQLHNLMLEDAAPTGAYISTPADVPNHRAKSGRTKGALAIVMAGLILGMIVAVVRHKMDRHVYVGSDLEALLGFGPMALLPDFGEVSEGAAEEHLLRLAAAIEHAHKQGHVRSCVFTGTNSGAGVTTIVTRVRALLEAMGKPTLYVDASGTSMDVEPEGAESEALQGTRALVAAGRSGRPAAISLQMSEEADHQTLVLTDAAPIKVSAETEYLVRFADCAIVVVESGVTTRAEIRDVASTLQRLNVGAVGFVLNRVGLAKADPAFRASVDAVEKHLQSQMGAVARRTRRTEAVVVANSAGRPVDSAPASFHVRAASAQAFPAGTESSSPAITNLESVSPESSSSQAESPESISQSAEARAVPVAEVNSAEGLPGERLISQPAAGADSTASSTAVSLEANPVAPAAIDSAEAKPVEDVSPVSAEFIPVDRASGPPFSAQSVQTPFGAQFLSAQALSSIESLIEPGASLMNLRGPASDAAFAAPVTAKADLPAPPVSAPQPHIESPVGPSQPDLDAAREEQGTEASRMEIRASESPTAAVPVIHQSMWAHREGLPLPSQPEPLHSIALPAAPAASIASQDPVLKEDSDIPWWLSEVPGHLAERPVPLLWEGEGPGKSRTVASHLRPAPVELPLHADPSRNQRAGSPVQQPPVERTPGFQGHPGSRPAQASARLPQQEDAPERLTSRLSGLRSLLTGLGLKEAHSSAGMPVAGSANRAPLDRGSMAPDASTRGSQGTAQFSSPTSQPADSGRREVSVAPEFLNPTTGIAEYQPGGAKTGEKPSARSFQPGAEFEMPTLPSRRGQYRNI